MDVFPELRHAFEDELIDPQFIEPDEFADSAPPANSRRLEELRSSQPPIDDVVEATSWWSDDGEDADDGDAVSGPPQPYRAPPKIGRNEPRPCGSGKKYKKCCGQ